jgi:asparagine synthase (glutamine-hydrolysing)
LVLAGVAALDEGTAGPKQDWVQRLQRVESRSELAALRGPFALGLSLLDGRTLLAVDRFGIQPLCYRIDGDRIHFAQRADALADSSTPIDPQALFDYLYAHTIPSPRTVWQGVQRLPPGHFAIFDKGLLTVAPYWTPRFAPPQRPASFDELRDEFRGLLQTAVQTELGDGKPACFLSGGTDSSTVAGMIGQAAGRAAATYSIGFEAEGYDEMAFARIAARHFGTEHHEYYVTPEDLLRSIPDVAAYYDQPFGNSSAVPAFHCARMAREDGVTRLLAGDGGDELFGGNTRYAKQRVFGWYDAVPPALRHIAEPMFGVAAGIPLLGKPASYIAQAKVPMPDRTQTYNQLQRLGIAQVLTPSFLARVDITGPLTQQRAVWAQAQASTLLDRQLAFDWRYTLSENDLPKVCGTAALAGVEVGFPMLDAALVDFSLRLPTAYKLRGLKLRWFFKEALRGFLPDEIIRKKKQGFGLPFGVWAHRHAALRAFAADALGSLSTRGMVRPDFIRSLLHERLAEHPGYYGEMIWILMMLEHWLRKHAPDWRLES